MASSNAALAGYNAPIVLETPDADITFNAASGDTYWCDPELCAGLDMAPIRAPIDNVPQDHGGIVHDFFLGPRHVTLGGVLVVRSATTEAGYLAARETLEGNLADALFSLLQADGTLTITRADLSEAALTVRCDVPVTFPGAWQKRFIFGLVAADPTFSVTEPEEEP